MAESTSTVAKKNNTWLWVLLFVTLALTVYVNVQSSDEADEIVLYKPNIQNSKRSTPETVKKNRRQLQEDANLIVVPDDLINLALLQRKQTLQSVGNAFVPRSWYVPPPTQPIEEDYTPEAPKAPEVPFKYIGRFDAYQIYLQQGDELYTVEVGDTIKGVWRVESDQPNHIELTYIPLNETKILAKN